MDEGSVSPLSVSHLQTSMRHHPSFYHVLLVLLAFLVATVSPAAGQDAADQIRLNQLGFYPAQPKTAVVVGAPTKTFHLVTPDAVDTVYTGTLTDAAMWSPSGETVRRAVFSGFDEVGIYVLTVPGLGLSHPFEIAPHVHQHLARAAVKMYYFQRASTPLREPYAGDWARPAGHPDLQVRIHPSAATDARPAGSTIATPRGWYDAGDYNKYVVNSGISTGALLMLYEHYPTYFDALETNIPESGNGVPDLLDEILWNVRWMLSMQDPADGGVYNKTTTANFSGAVMPHRATATRYVVQKGTAATLDFAAVAAMAARIYDDFEDELPGLADSLRTAALNAWEWAETHPDVPYDQDAMNAEYNPDINTGGYGDSDFSDEFAWAAAELLITTGEERFGEAFEEQAGGIWIPGWGDVEPMGYYSLLYHRSDVAEDVDIDRVRRAVLGLADNMVGAYDGSAYGIVMGDHGGFWWGSNSLAGNQAMLLLQVYRLTGEQDYFDAALANLDYLLGRNATGYSFVTGYGDHTPMNPHHRQSEADDIRAPVPGMLVGGPNPGQEDGCSYPSDFPAQSYVDDWCSYASNEITINWNAPLAYVAGAIEATLSESGTPSATEPARQPAGSLALTSYPNPMATTAQIRFTLDAPADVNLDVYDMLGRKVATVVAGDRVQAGPHECTFDARRLPAGVYLVRLQADARHVAQPLVVAR